MFVCALSALEMDVCVCVCMHHSVFNKQIMQPIFALGALSILPAATSDDEQDATMHVSSSRSRARTAEFGARIVILSSTQVAAVVCLFFMPSSPQRGRDAHAHAGAYEFAVSRAEFTCVRACMRRVLQLLRRPTSE